MKELPLLVLVACALLLTTTVRAEYGLVGVKKGDYFTYGNFILHYSSDDPFYASSKPFDVTNLLYINETEWRQITIKNVTGTRVFLDTSVHYKNGTESNSSNDVDVRSGFGTAFCMVISANLSLNDPIYNRTFLSISSVTNRSYEVGTRLTVCADETFHMNDTRIEGSVVENGTLDIVTFWYWDRASGMVAEYSSTHTELFGNYTTTWSWSYSITSSNLWTVPEYAAWLPMAMIIAISTPAILVGKKRFQKNRRQSLLDHSPAR